MAGHECRVDTFPDDNDANVDRYQAVCTCSWASDIWETEGGAETARRWHEDHPGTGEVPAIEENQP